MTIWCEDKDNGCITKFNLSGSETKAKNIFNQHYAKRYILRKIVK